MRKSSICVPSAKYTASWSLSPPSPRSTDSLRNTILIAAQRDRRGLERRVPADERALEPEVPGAGAVFLDREVAKVRVVADDELGDRVDEVIRLGRAEAVENRRLRALAERDDRVRERRAAVAFAPVQHEDRILV